MTIHTDIKYHELSLTLFLTYDHNEWNWRYNIIIHSILLGGNRLCINNIKFYSL